MTDNLQYGKTQAASRQSKHVEIKDSEDVLESLVLLSHSRIGGRGNRNTGVGHTSRGVDGSGRRNVLVRHIGELGIIGRTLGIRGESLQRVRVRVVAGLLGDRLVPVPRHNKAVIIRAIADTGSRLVHKLGSLKRVKTGIGGLGGVVGPFAGSGAVPDGVEIANDGVRDTDINRDESVELRKIDGRLIDLLNLLDDHITGILTHLDTLVIVHNGVVAPSLDIGDGGSVRAVNEGEGGVVAHLNNIVESGRVGANTHVQDEKILPPAETVVDLDVVERKGRDGKSQTRVLGIEEGDGKIEEFAGAEGVAGRHGVNHGGNVSDHVPVTDALGSIDVELGVKVEPVAVKLVDNQIIEGDVDLFNKIVHEVSGPADGGISVDGTTSIGRTDSNERKTDAKPGVEDVIAGTIHGRGEFVTETGKTRNVSENNGEEREPISLFDGTHEIGDRRATTIKVRLQVGEGRQIYETGSSSYSGTTHNRSHYSPQ